MKYIGKQVASGSDDILEPMFRLHPNEVRVLVKLLDHYRRTIPKIDMPTIQRMNTMFRIFNNYLLEKYEKNG